MQFRDFTNPDKFVATMFKLMCVILALAIIRDLLVGLCSRLSFAQALAAFAFLLLLSPVAYLVWRARRGAPARHDRRGAERTPVLPGWEGDHE
jgi:membrane protein implicated in regulation of membrane protease activity